MKTVLLILCPSAAIASGYATDAASGSLWGVDLGTTSRATTVGPQLAIDTTSTRATKLVSASPERESFSMWEGIPSPSKFTGAEAAYYALGLMDA